MIIKPRSSPPTAGKNVKDYLKSSLSAVWMKTAKFGVKKLLDCLAVGAGGFVGAVLRYLIGLIPLEPESGFPVKTFAINIIGCFAIGIIAGFAEKSAIDPRLLLLLKVGVCGGFTTFSSFALEARGLLSAGSTLVFALYVVLSVAVGIAAVMLGQIIIK